MVDPRADHDTDRQERRIPIDAGQPVELRVNNHNGDVVVRLGDGPDVVVRHTKHGHGGRHADEAELGIDVRGNRIDVQPRLPNVGGWEGLDIDIDLGLDLFKRKREKRSRVRIGGGGVRYDIEVALPRAAQIGLVDVRNASGEVEIAEVGGTVNVSTASGELRLREVSGELAVHSASGDLVVSRPRGKLTARTASGDIQIDGGVLSDLTIASASGDIVLETALTGDGAHRIDTVSGDVLLKLGVEAVTLRFQTVSGDASVEAPFERVEKRLWRIGSGGPMIAVKSVSGDLSARADITAAASARTEPLATFSRTEPAPPIPPTPPMPATPPVPPTPPISVLDADAPTRPIDAAPADSAATTEPAAVEPLMASGDAMPNDAAPDDEGGDLDRLAVLQAVERGEIDIEEALRRLENDPVSAESP